MTTLPTFLIPETLTGKEAGGHKQQDTAAAVEIDGLAQRRLLLTLGIVETQEQQMVKVGIWASPDGQDWGKDAVLSLPQKFYRGTSSYLLDLSSSPNARFVQARWEMERWGRGKLIPHFKLYLFAEPL